MDAQQEEAAVILYGLSLSCAAAAAVAVSDTDATTAATADADAGICSGSSFSCAAVAAAAAVVSSADDTSGVLHARETAGSDITPWLLSFSYMRNSIFHLFWGQGGQKCLPLPGSFHRSPFASPSALHTPHLFHTLRFPLQSNDTPWISLLLNPVARSTPA